MVVVLVAVDVTMQREEIGRDCFRKERFFWSEVRERVSVNEGGVRGAEEVRIRWVSKSTVV